jgi:hypothetical protein
LAMTVYLISVRGSAHATTGNNPGITRRSP